MDAAINPGKKVDLPPNSLHLHRKRLPFLGASAFASRRRIGVRLDSVSVGNDADAVERKLLT